MKNINYTVNAEFVKDTHRFYHKKYSWAVGQIIMLIRGKDIHSILEIGCNYGAILIMLKDRMKIDDYTGADLFDYNKLKRRYGYHFPFIKIDLNRDDLSELPQKDLVLMIDVLEHLDDPASILRKLKLKKYLLIKIPLEKGIIKNMLMALGFAGKIGHKHPSGHLHGYYLKEGLNLAKKGNLEILDWHYAFNPLWLNYPNLNKGFTLHKKIFYNFDRLCRILLPKRVYLSLFGGTLLMLCMRRNK